MAARKKRRKRARRLQSRARPRPTRGRTWLRGHGWLIGLIALLLVGGIGAVFLIQRGTEDTPPSEEVSLDKSKGAADAPVVVVEYGDFQ